MNQPVRWRGLALIALIAWGATGMIWFYPSPSPVALLSGDSVTPNRVRAGGVVTVSRSFRVLRDEPLIVTRAMILGDCKISCEIIDLPSGHLTLTPGDYIDIKREHVIPAIARPGVWRLTFSVTWDDRFGRSVRAQLPELAIEVLP